jgi:hypothetical protein
MREGRTVLQSLSQCQERMRRFGKTITRTADFCLLVSGQVVDDKCSPFGYGREPVVPVDRKTPLDLFEAQLVRWPCRAYLVASSPLSVASIPMRLPPGNSKTLTCQITVAAVSRTATVTATNGDGNRRSRLRGMEASWPHLSR